MRFASRLGCECRPARCEHSAFEDQFVVGEDGVGFVVLADGQAQVADQRPAALVDHRRQSGADAKSQTSMGKSRLFMHNMRLIAPIIQISFSIIYEGTIHNLRYYMTHD